MASPRPKLLEYDVSVDAERAARSGRGGSALVAEQAWSPEHLALAALVRCTLESLDHHLQRQSVTGSAKGEARGVVTRRESDGLYAFVEIEARFEVALGAELERGGVVDLVDRAERGCFIGNSLTTRPAYHWTVNGEVIR